MPLRLTLLLTTALTLLLAAVRAVGGVWPGQQLAYEARASRTDYDLMLLDLRTGVRVDASRNPHADRHPAWSPDGTRLVFASNRDGGWALYVREMPGSEAVRITAGQAPAWSADGTTLAYHTLLTGANRIMTLPVDFDGTPTGEPQRIITGEFPAWSPDGRYLLFESYRAGNQDVLRIDLDTGELHNLTETQGDGEWGATYAPGGVAYTSNRTYHWGIYQRAEDGTAERMTAIVGDAAQPAFSPDGRWMAFELYDSISARSLHLLPADARAASSTRRLTARDATDDRFPAWRPVR